MKKWGIVFLAIAVVAVLFFFLLKTQSTAVISVGGEEITVLVADNGLERAKGLSGTTVDGLGADGMLFVFDDYSERTFWMNGMNYNLDMIWIRDGKVMKIQKNIPAPEGGEDPETFDSRPFKVDMALEVPAGFVERYGIMEGHLVQVAP